MADCGIECRCRCWRPSGDACRGHAGDVSRVSARTAVFPPHRQPMVDTSRRLPSSRRTGIRWAPTATVCVRPSNAARARATPMLCDRQQAPGRRLCGGAEVALSRPHESRAAMDLCDKSHCLFREYRTRLYRGTTLRDESLTRRALAPMSVPSSTPWRHGTRSRLTCCHVPLSRRSASP